MINDTINNNYNNNNDFNNDDSNIQVLARLLACSPDNVKDIFSVGLLKIVLPFLTNQAAQFYSRGIADFIF